MAKENARKKKVDPNAPSEQGAPMFLDALHVSVMRRGEPVNIAGGVLVTETDLTDDEIDELTAMRMVRVATNREIELADARAAAVRPKRGAPDPAAQ